jgi:hypothetical protein
MTTKRRKLETIVGHKVSLPDIYKQAASKGLQTPSKSVEEAIETSLAEPPKDSAEYQAVDPEDIMPAEHEETQPPPVPRPNKTGGSNRGRIVAASIAGAVVTAAVVVALVFVFGDKGANASPTTANISTAAARAPALRRASDLQTESAPLKGPATTAGAEPAQPSVDIENKTAGNEIEKGPSTDGSDAAASDQRPQTGTGLVAIAGKADSGFVDKDGGWAWWQKCDNRIKANSLPQALYACGQGLEVAANKKVKAALFFSIGTIYEKAEDRAQAKASYEKALKARPRNKAAKRKLASFLNSK